MNNDTLQKVAFISLAAAVLASGTTLRAQPTGGGERSVLQSVGISPRLGERLPLDAEFVDSFGKRLRLGDCLTGRPVILHLVYYDCPMLCKLSSDGLLSTLSVLSLELGEDFTIVTLSFDPREGPELSARAREMAIERCGAEAVERGWRFLTGDAAAIESVTQSVGFRYTYDETTRQYAHAAGLFVLTPEGVASRYLSGIEYSPRDLRLAVVEASDGKVGALGDQVMLLCYMYNPVTGKYGLAIITALRAAGVATVAAMALAIGLMIRREHRPADVETAITDIHPARPAGGQERG